MKKTNYFSIVRLIVNAQMADELERCFSYATYCWNELLKMHNEYQKEHNGEIEKSNERLKRFRKIRNTQEWQMRLPPYICDCVSDRLHNAIHTVCVHNKILKTKKLRGEALSEPYEHLQFKKETKSSCAKSFEFSWDRILKNQFKPKGKNFTFGITLSRYSVVDPKYRQMEITELPKGLAEGTARITKAAIFRRYNEYFVAFNMRIIVQKEYAKAPENTVGIDPGVKTILTLSNGEKFSFPKKLKKLEKRVKFFKGRMKKRKVEDKDIQSKNYYRARDKYIKALKDIYNLKQDWIHKVTTKLAKSYSEIKWEDVDTSELLQKRGHKLSDNIQKSNWFKIKHLLKEKVDLRRGIFKEIDPIKASATQTCSNCGYIRKGNEKLKLSDRKFVCPKCGYIEDRDINAAKNIAKF